MSSRGRGRGGHFRGNDYNRGGFQESMPIRSAGNTPGYRGGSNNRGGSSNRGQYSFSRGGYGSGSRDGPQDNGPSPGIYQPRQIPPVDSTVTEAENRLVRETKGKHFPLPTSGTDVPMMVPGRRSYGTLGTAIVLRTNYLPIIALNAKDDKPLYRYTITIDNTTAASKAFKRQVIQYILNLPELRSVVKATDYSTILITATKLNFLAANGSWSQKGHHLRPANPATQTNASGAFGFTIKFERELSLQATIRQLMATVVEGQSVFAADIIQALNIVLARAPNEANNVAAGSTNKFFPYPNNPLAQSYNLEAGLEALRGYFSSVRPAVNRMLVNVNVTSGAFWKAQSVTDLLRELPNDQLGLLRGLRILVKYPSKGKANNTAPVHRTMIGLSDGNARSLTFSWNNRNTTVEHYYQQKYGTTLQQPTQLCVNVGTDRSPAHVPQELCAVAPGQQFRRFLSPNQTTRMLDFASRRPNANAHSIAGDGDLQSVSSGAQGLQLLGLKGLAGAVDPQISTVNQFGFRVGTQLLSVPGRVLQTPTLVYGGKGDRVVAPPKPELGSWNNRGQRFIAAGSFNVTAAIIIRPRNSSAPDPALTTTISELQKHVQQCGTGLGQYLGLADVVTESWTERNRPSNRAAIDSRFGTAQAKGVQLAVVILEAADRWIYAQIKTLADTKYGIHTVCCVRGKVMQERGQGMFFGNLALKINVKAGGINHGVQGLFTAPLTPDRTMLVGIDVTHPSPGSAEAAPSIACLVANTNKHLSQWPGSIRKRAPRQEIIDPTPDEKDDRKKKKKIVKYHRELNEESGDIRTMMEERLAVWKKNNQQLPDRIIVYRDGVSEGQYDLVLRHEWPEIQKAFNKFYKPDNHPKVAIIVVGKRHHTRFYPTSEASAASKGFNPLPGTIVDRGISNKIMSEFWLQAHHGLQGSARPAHYVVIKDDIGFEADQLQTFTHRLCYTFSRATKAISICPPAYYADLLADRTRSYEYEALNENNSGRAYSQNQSAWDGTIHDNIKDRTWYI